MEREACFGKIVFFFLISWSQVDSLVDDHMFENWDDEDFGFYDTDSDEEAGTKVRDTVLESLLSKALKRVNVSASIAPVIGDSLDPLDLTKLTGSIQVQANNDYAEVDLNTDNITLKG